MIYTVTFNPSLDYAVGLDRLRPGELNRADYENLLPGGKGINVSVVLHNLGMESVALGFTAGFTGRQISKELEDRGCRTDFISLSSGFSRINVKVKAEEETEINGRGPAIGEEDVRQLFSRLEGLRDGDVLVLAGSIPDSLPEDIYERIMAFLTEGGKNVRIVVDATKGLLLNVLKYRPFLIKPNKHELEELFGVRLSKREEIVACAGRLREMGARNVLVSMAGDGAMLLSETGEVLESEAPKGVVVNSVGAGDSMVAGFLTGYLTTGDYRKAFLMGVATGSASAFSSRLAVRSEVEALYRQIAHEDWRIS